MCGILGFALEKPVEMAHVFKVLHKLERHQYPNEPKPVGGYGAGIALVTSSGKVDLEKVGKAEGSPVERLSKVCRITKASVLVGHVRMPSPNFMETAHFKETAQPYMAQCSSGLSIVSAHNGYVANYEIIRARLGEKHVFESERIGLIDSEVIPHLFEELLGAEKNPSKALDKLFSTIEGANTLSLLQVEDKQLFLHFVHKGKTRGLHVWKNKNGEIIFCSRKEPLAENFGHMLNSGGFRECVSIPYGEEGSFKATFVFDIRLAKDK